MLRAKSYKKKLKKSQIKLRKHKTFSIKGGNRNNNSRSKKKQKGGVMFEAPDGKTYQTPEEYGRYKELKEVFEERRRRNESIEITPDVVSQTAIKLNIPNMEQGEIDSMVTLLTTHLATFDPNKVSVRDYIEGNIFGDKKPGPGGYQNLKEIITAALAATAAATASSGTSASQAATAAAAANVRKEQAEDEVAREAVKEAEDALKEAVTLEQKRNAKKEVIQRNAELEQELEQTKIARRRAATAAAAAAAAKNATVEAESLRDQLAAEKEAKLDNMAGEAAESAAGGDLQALVDMLTMILKDDDKKGGGKKKIYKQKGGFDYQPETKMVENIINKYKEQQKENILSYANDMDKANKDGSGDALVNFLRGAWIDFIDSNLTIEKVGGQPNIQNSKPKFQANAEEMMMDEVNELIIKDNTKIINELDKFSKIKKFPEVFRTKQDLINKFFNQDWLEHTANYEKKTKDLIPNFKLAVTNKDISKLESAGNEEAGEGKVSPPPANTVNSTTTDTGTDLPESPDVIAGGGTIDIPMNNNTRNLLKVTTATKNGQLIREFDTIFTQLDTAKLNAGYNEDQTIIKTFQMITSKLDAQISELSSFRDELEKKSWSGNVWPEEEQVAWSDTNLNLIDYAEFNNRFNKFGPKWFKEWEAIRNKHKNQFEDEKRQILVAIKQMNSRAIYAMERRQQDNLDALKNELNKKNTNPDLKSKIIAIIKDQINKNTDGTVGLLHTDLSKYNSMFNLEFNNQNIGLLFDLTNIDMKDKAYTVSTNPTIFQIQKEKKENTEKFIYKLDIILGYLQYLSICFQLDGGAITDETKKNVNKISTTPIQNLQLGEEKIKMICVMVAKNDTIVEELINYTFGLLFGEILTNKKKYDEHCNYINYIALFLTTKLGLINRLITDKQQISSDEGVGSLIDMLLSDTFEEETNKTPAENANNYSSHIEASLNEYIEIFNQFIAEDKKREELIKQQKIQELIDEERRNAEQEETENEIVSKNVRSLWNGEDGFKDIYNNRNNSQQTLTEDSWATPDENNTYSFFGTKYFGIYLYLTIRYIRNKKDSLNFNLIEKYNFYLLIYRVFGNSEQKSQLFKNNNIITDNRNGFFAGDRYLETVQLKLNEIRTKPIDENNSDFLKFHIEVMILYLMQKYKDVTKIKQEKIEMFLFSMFSLIPNVSVKPLDGDDANKKSLEVFYNDRILNRIKKGDETMGQILEESNKFVVGGRILEVEFDYHSVIDGLVDLIHKNLIFLNPLKALYKYVFSKINVIMRISDVQCAKRQGYKPRLINKLLVSQSGDSLLFSNIENDRIKIIEDKNKISADKQSSLKTFQFDFMNHIYGPNDSDDMMTDRINYGFMNLLKSYDNVPGPRWRESILSSVYFTYGFSGSGKTYNTKNIIGSLLAYIAENHSMVKKIDIRYSELVAATTPDSDVLMSGKDFNGPISNHASWQKFEDDFRGDEGGADQLEKYKAELLPYFFTKDSENYPPLVESQDFVPFKKNNKLFDKVVSLFDVWDTTMDDKKGQWNNRIEGGYIREIFVYNEKDKNFDSLELGFSDQLHAKYWFEKFYGYSNKLQSIKDNKSNYEYENDEGYIGIDEPNNMFQEDIMNEENEIKEEGTTGFNFKKINLGLDFQDKTLLDYNYLPFDEWVLVNRHMPMRRQTFDDLNSFLQSGSSISWETNRNLVSTGGVEDQKIISERAKVFDNVEKFVTGRVYEYEQNIDDLFGKFKDKPGNDANKLISKWQKFNTHFIDAAQKIDKTISNMIDNPDGYAVNGSFKPMYFLTAPDNKNIGFKITAQPIKLFDDNIELKISLEKGQDNDSFMIITDCNNTEVKSAGFAITKTTPTLADLAGGYQTVLDEYNQAKAALLAIIPGDRKETWGRDEINREIAKLQNYPFKRQNFQLGNGNNLDDSADTETYILFKRRHSDSNKSKVTKLMERDGYDVVPHILVFNGQHLANLGMGDIGSGDTFLEKGYVVKGKAYHLSQFYTKKDNLKSTTKALYLPFLYMNGQSPSLNKLNAFEFLDYALKHRATNNYDSKYVSNRGGYTTDGKQRLIREIERVFAHSNDLETKAIEFKENVRKAFENINLHINILEIKPEYKQLLENYRNAEETLDDYYKSKTEAYFSNERIASPIPQNEWSTNGKSKTFEELKDKVSVQINNGQNISFVKDYFQKTDYFGGEGSNGEKWKNGFADSRKKIIQQVKSKFLEHIADGLPLDSDITTGETFVDKIKLIATDFKQFMDMIKDEYKPIVKEKYITMINIKEKINKKWAEGVPDEIPNLEQTINLKMSQLQLRDKLKKHIRKNLFSPENGTDIDEHKIQVTVRAEQITDIQEPNKYKHIHLLKEGCRKTIKDILEKDLLYQDTVNRYFKFGEKKLELVKIKLEESKLLKLRKVEKTGQNIWEQVVDDKFDDEFKNYWESSKKLGYTTESIDNFKKIQTQPQYINIYEKKDDAEEEKKNKKSMEKKFKYHYDAVDTFKKTSATYNNDRSSRSHLVYEIRVGVKKEGGKMKYHNIIICDLAGKEDVISDEKMKEYIRNIYRGAIEEGAKFNSITSGGAGAKSRVKRAKIEEAKRKTEEYASKNVDYRPERKNAMSQNENKPKMFSVVQKVKGKSVNDNDHPFTTQMNYLIEINDKYANDAKDPKPIFSNSEGDLKFADNFDINHPNILDLRGEGRMINATLENLEDQLKGTNEYLAPLNPTFSYFRQLGKDARQKKNFNSLQNVASLPDSSAKLSEEYKQYGRILDRELNVQNYPKPWPNEGEIWDTKDNPNYEKYYGEWVDPSKKLQNKISLITKGKPPNYYILLAINLNDRSTESDIELKKVKNMNGEEKWVDDIEGNQEKLKESAAKRNSDLAHLGYESKTSETDSDYYNFKSSSLLTTLNYIRNITTPINDNVTLEQGTDSITKLNLLNKRYLFCYNDKDKSLIPRIQSAEDSETREIIKYHPFNQKNYFDIQKTTGLEEKENDSNLMELDFANSSKNFERLKKIMDFDFLYLHPLNSNYVLLDDMDETAKALSEAALKAEAATAQNQRDIERERQRKMDEARKMQDNEALRIANEAIRTRQDELGGQSKDVCMPTGKFASSKEECCDRDGAVSYGSNPPQMCDNKVDAPDPAPVSDAAAAATKAASSVLIPISQDLTTGDTNISDTASKSNDTGQKSNIDSKFDADANVGDGKTADADGKTVDVGDGKTADVVVGDSDSDGSTMSDDINYQVSRDFNFKSDDIDRPDVSQLKKKGDEFRKGQIAGKRRNINHMGNNLCSDAFNKEINPTFKNQYKKSANKPKMLNDTCSNLYGRDVQKNGYNFQCTRRTETAEETKYREDKELDPYRVKKLKKHTTQTKVMGNGVIGCLANKSKLFNNKNEAIFKKQNRELFIDQQGGGGLVDQNYLFKINLLKHPWLNDSDYLSRFIENETVMTKCIQLDEEEKVSEIQFEKQFIKQIFTGGKRKTRRKRNKSNKKKKKKIQIKNKSKKNRKKLKNKTRKK